MPKPSPVLAFGLRVLAWLPVTFAIWYYLSILITRPVRLLADLLLPWLWPDVFSSVDQSAHELVIVTAFSPAAASANIGASGNLFFEINALQYGYSLPLYTALVLATPGDEGVRVWRWLIGLVVLLAAQLWGVSFDALKTALITFQASGVTPRTLTEWSEVGVGLGYQFGYLILPAVTPLVVWLILFRDYVGALAPALRGRRNTPPS